MRNQSHELELLRAVGSCLLFENTFYEKGSDIAERIAELSQQVKPEFLSSLAVYARSRLNLRHVSLWLAVQNLRRKDGIRKAETVASVIQRADELAEIVALYWRQNPKPSKQNKGGAPLAHALKRGLAEAFTRFDEYALSKYDRATSVRLRDVLFLCHAKPKEIEGKTSRYRLDATAQAALWKKLVANTLTVPDTWEVALSTGQDKKETFERLIRERKIGYLALLRNLRNMAEVGVEWELVTDALVEGAPRSRALPFQFVSAWRFAPSYAAAIDTAMLCALGSAQRLSGLTLIVIDVSGSMDAPLSAKSKLNRIDAASALAVLCREVCDDVRVFTFSEVAVEVQAARGLALVDLVHRSQMHTGTYLGRAVTTIASHVRNFTRMLVITDEQAHDGLPSIIGSKAYLINIASYKPALPAEHTGWIRINGFSERIVDFIRFDEAIEQTQDASAILSNLQ